MFEMMTVIQRLHIGLDIFKTSGEAVRVQLTAIMPPPPYEDDYNDNNNGSAACTKDDHQAGSESQKSTIVSLSAICNVGLGC